MANTNQQNKNQPKQNPHEQPATPAQPVELTEEELEHVVGGGIIVDYDVINEK